MHSEFRKSNQSVGVYSEFRKSNQSAGVYSDFRKSNHSAGVHYGSESPKMSHQISHFPGSGGMSDLASSVHRASGASKQASGWASLNKRILSGSKPIAIPDYLVPFHSIPSQKILPQHIRNLPCHGPCLVPYAWKTVCPET